MTDEKKNPVPVPANSETVKPVPVQSAIVSPESKTPVARTSIVRIQPRTDEPGKAESQSNPATVKNVSLSAKDFAPGIGEMLGILDEIRVRVISTSARAALTPEQSERIAETARCSEKSLSAGTNALARIAARHCETVGDSMDIAIVAATFADMTISTIDCLGELKAIRKENIERARKFDRSAT